MRTNNQEFGIVGEFTYFSISREFNLTRTLVVGMPKTPIEAANDATLLKDIKNLGAGVLGSLKTLGFPIHGRLTLGEFKAAAGSPEQVEAKYRAAGTDGGFMMSRVRSLWSGVVQGGTKRKEMASDPQSQENEAEKKQALDGNFLLAPQQIPGVDGETGQDKTQKEVPEVDAMDRAPDPTKAMPLGFTMGGPQLSVIPDVTLNVSQDARNINAPTVLLPGEPAPMIPAIALGSQIMEVRKTMPETLENYQLQIAEDPELAPFKADGDEDIMGDGKGAVLEEARVGNNAPVPGQKRGVEWLMQMTNGGRPSVDASQQKSEMVTGTRHPFKQATLFRNHDAKMKVSKQLAMAAVLERERMMSEENAMDIRESDASWFKYNAATQGVRAPFMPPEQSNYLSRGPMVTSFQMLGPDQLVDQWPPCPYEWEQQSGPFQ